MRVAERALTTILLIVGLLFSPDAHSSSMQVPDVVELNSLSNIYTGNTFDHFMHTDIASCEACHHHMAGMPTENPECMPCHENSNGVGEMACTGCHAPNPGDAIQMKESQQLDLFHTDTTGLKRAYHLQCMGCHREMEAATGCEDCHPKKDGRMETPELEK